MSNLNNIQQLFNDEKQTQANELEEMLRERQVSNVETIGTGTTDGLVIEFEGGAAAVIQAPERQRGLQVEITTQ